jgi:hypothetical protein
LIRTKPGQNSGGGQDRVGSQIHNRPNGC